MNIDELLEVPYRQRLQIHAAISDIIEKATADNDGLKINRIEKDLTRFLIRKWSRTSTKAVRKSVKVTEIGQP